MITAVLWDFGGVILTSPFEAFNRFERERGLPIDFIRTVNATNPDRNAWARLERSDISPFEFDAAFADDAAALGRDVRGSDVLTLLAGDVRPTMVQLLDRVIAAGFKVACLTNNVVSSGDVVSSGESTVASDRSAEIAAIMQRFHAVVESSKVGVRKPEPRFYEIACELLDVQPTDCAFLDDLGINLKPAAAMGMRTIKVLTAEQAIDDLTALLGLDDERPDR